jgi:hypothetical protein
MKYEAGMKIRHKAVLDLWSVIEVDNETITIERKNSQLRVPAEVLDTHFIICEEKE